jgi:hypothetical protein
MTHDENTHDEYPTMIIDIIYKEKGEEVTELYWLFMPAELTKDEVMQSGAWKKQTLFGPFNTEEEVTENRCEVARALGGYFEERW